MEKTLLSLPAVRISEINPEKSYFIINHGYGAYLKLGDSIQNKSYRYAWAHEGQRKDGDKPYAWKIIRLADNTYLFKCLAKNTDGVLSLSVEQNQDGFAVYGYPTIEDPGVPGRISLQPADNDDTRSYIIIGGQHMNASSHKDSNNERRVYASRAKAEDRYQWLIVSAD